MSHESGPESHNLSSDSYESDWDCMHKAKRPLARQRYSENGTRNTKLESGKGHQPFRFVHALHDTPKGSSPCSETDASRYTRTTVRGTSC